MFRFHVSAAGYSGCPKSWLQYAINRYRRILATLQITSAHGFAGKGQRFWPWGAVLNKIKYFQYCTNILRGHGMRVFGRKNAIVLPIYINLGMHGRYFNRNAFAICNEKLLWHTRFRSGSVSWYRWLIAGVSFEMRNPGGVGLACCRSGWVRSELGAVKENQELWRFHDSAGMTGSVMY